MIKLLRRLALPIICLLALMYMSAAVCAEESFSIKLRSDGKGFTVDAIGAEDTDSYKVSINGGESFFAVNKLPFSIYSLPESTYQICMLKNDSILSEVRALCIGDSGIEKGREVELSVSAFAESDFKNGSLIVNIDNYDINRNYLITYDGGRTWRPVNARKTVIKGLYSDTYTVCVRCLDKPEAKSRTVDITVPMKPVSDRRMLKVPLIKQNPELPTGCEVTSLAMAINFTGIKISKTVLSDVFLEKVGYREGDYRRAFVGDPRKNDAYGCYAGVIRKAAVKFLDTVSGRTFEVKDLTGCSPERLYAYVDMGYPVIVWATNKMIEPVEGAVWTDPKTGNEIKWTGNEHCMLLTGYDKKAGVVYMNDPLYGITAFKTELFEQRFYDLEQQAIVIAETTEGK